MMKLWDKEISTEQRILNFTTGKDPVYDLDLAPFDVLGTMAHTVMLAETDLITREEAATLVSELTGIFEEAVDGKLRLEEGVEDIHSQVEMMLTTAGLARSAISAKSGRA